MAVKASVDTSNQTTVRVGQENAIKVTSTQTGIASATFADTATNVVGGRADVTQLAVSGLSTFTGIGTFIGDLYVGGDLYLTDDLVLDNISGSSLNISGISTVGFITATDVWVSGAVTATSYYGDGQHLTGVGNTLNIATNTLTVTGVSTFNEDVKFIGANTNARWDHSTSDLILFNNTRLEFGDNKDFEIWHGGSHTFMKNSGGDLRIRGDVIKLAREDGSETYLEANVNNEVKLFFNGNEKFTTTLQGVEIGTVAISTVGFITATDVWVSGAVTATSYHGDGQYLTGVGNTSDVSTNSLVVSGISTFGDDISVTGDILVTDNIKHKGDTDTYIEFTADKLRFITGGKEFINVTQSGASSVVINEQPDYDCDFRVEGISDEYLIFTDAATDKVGIGSAIPKAKLDINGTLNVAGVTTFNQDVNFPGAAYNILWDQATSKFKFDDSAQCVFGSASGGDMKLFHQSGNSTIRNETGQFRIAGNDIRLQTQNHSEDYLLAVDGGSVSIFHNDVKRLETTASGVDITDTLNVAGVSTFVGIVTTSSDLYIGGTLTAGAIDGGTY